MLFFFLRQFAFSFAPVAVLGESYVAKELENNFFYIWDRNWKISAGELDIIAHHKHTMHIIEVKTRHIDGHAAFPAVDAVDIFKIKKIRELAKVYVYRHQKNIRRYRIRNYQFDIVSVLYSRKGCGYYLKAEYHPNAFAWESDFG